MAGDQAPERTAQPEDLGLLLRADDGTAYLIPRAELERFRLSNEGRAAVEAGVADAEAGDVRGHGQYIGQFSMTMPVWYPIWTTGFWMTGPYKTHSSGYYPPLR
jgi:hypothetical protein